MTPCPITADRDEWRGADLRGALAEASLVEIVDDCGWSLSLCFGKGDAARDKMRAVSEMIRAEALSDA